jgi:hypothetical protein
MATRPHLDTSTMRFSRIISILLLATSTQPLHIIGPDTTSIPYLVPRFFQNACDHSDAYFTETVTSPTSMEDVSAISFASPPPYVTSTNIKRTPSFWTHEPFCLESVEAQGGFCVYTNMNFAQGRGISIVATPNDIQYILQAEIFLKATHNTAAVYAPGAAKYSRLSAPGEKRFEVIANGTFERGELLHSYTPIIIIEDPWVQHLNRLDYTFLLRIAVDRLPPASQELFLSQYAATHRDPYIDRMDMNAFAAYIGRSDMGFSAAFPETAVGGLKVRLEESDADL